MMVERQGRGGKREATPFEGTESFNRRLADKISNAISQATGQGREEVAERLWTIHREIVTQDRTVSEGWRSGDRRGK